jgi:acetyl esterase/lipase
MPFDALREEAYLYIRSETNRWVWHVPIFLSVLILVASPYFVNRGWNIRRVDPQYRVPMLYAPLSIFFHNWSISMFQKARAPELPVGPKGIRVSGRDVPSDNATIRVYIYESQNKKPHSAALLWIHGGGLVSGNATQDTDFLELVLRALNIVVVSVEYRLAPQHPYPQPLNDCYAAFLWMHDHSDELGIDPRRIAIGGASAGGGLTAALVQRAYDEGRVKPVFQALMYPMLDDRTTLTRNTAGRGKLIWTPEQNLFGWTSYLGQTPTLNDERPYAAAARRKDLSGLPPAWIGVGDLDLFHDEDVDYCRRLESAGVSCPLDVVPKAYHGFNMAAKKAPGSIDFNERMIAALRVGLEATAKS